MFRKEAESLKAIYECQVNTSQKQMDEFVKHAMPYLRELVKWYDRNQEAAFALNDLDCKLRYCEE